MILQFELKYVLLSHMLSKISIIEFTAYSWVHERFKGDDTKHTIGCII